MMRPAFFRAAAAAFGALGLAAGTARALVTLNDGTDKIYVSGTFTMGYDSNISASSSNTSDTTMNGGVMLEYQRHAGLIAVNANAGLTDNRYLNNPSYDNVDPTFSLEFDKSSGRTTGTLNLNASRTSQADAAVNLYTTAWDYNASLNVHYPVIDRYSFAGVLSAGYLDYSRTSGQPLVNLSTYSSSLSLFYILSDERDLFATYRYRYEESPGDFSAIDNSVSLGVHGKVFWEINGSLYVGYQIRGLQGVPAPGTASAGSHGALTANGSVSWTANRKLAFTASLSKDFQTTAIDSTTDTTASALNATYAVTSRLSAGAGVGAGEDRFLGPEGVVPGTREERLDTYFTSNASVSYTFSERMHVTLAYAYFRNWSNLGYASFSRNTLSLALATRW